MDVGVFSILALKSLAKINYNNNYKKIAVTLKNVTITNTLLLSLSLKTVKTKPKVAFNTKTNTKKTYRKSQSLQYLSFEKPKNTTLSIQF
jgi:hypothetical protein